MSTDSAAAVPRLTYLRIKNYRALRDVEFRDLTPLTVLIGPNGSGKSTVLDALDFLAEAVRGNLVQAWEKRDRFRGMRTRGSEENICFELNYELLNRSVFRYYLELEEVGGKVKIFYENATEKNVLGRLLWKYSLKQDAFYHEESVFKIIAKLPGSNNTSRNRKLAVNGISSERDESKMKLFSLTDSVARENINGLYISLTSYRLLHLTDDHLKGFSDQGPREKLSPNGDNLPNVLYYLHERHPDVLQRITQKMREWVPGLAEVIPEITSDERLLLRFRDAPFEKPLPAQYMSGGTMRLAALLALLYEPGATGLLGLEEPENELHPQLLPYLAEELVKATETRQLLVATHSPAMLNALEPKQVWILHRGADGYTQATRVADLPGIAELVEEGSPLGYLWSRNFFEVGNPLTSSGGN